MSLLHIPWSPTQLELFFLPKRYLAGFRSVGDWPKFAINAFSHQYDKEGINARHEEWERYDK